MRNAQAGDGMCAHNRQMFWFATLLAGCLIVVGGCNRPRKVDTAARDKAQEPAPAHPGTDVDGPGTAVEDTVATPPEVSEKVASEADQIGGTALIPDAGATVEGPGTMVPDDLTERLKRLKFQARREVMAARTTIENIPSYARSLEKFEREFEQWGMYAEVPVEPRHDELKSAIAEVVAKLDLELLYYNIVEPEAKPRRLPDVIHGDKSFDFEDDDIRHAFQVTIRVNKAEREQLVKLIAGLKDLERMLLIRRVKALPDGNLVNMEAYWFGEERYPLHQVVPRNLKTEMEQLGVTGSMEEVLRQDSVGYLQNAALSYRELNSSLAKVNEAMGLLSRSKFLEARSSFYRRAAEAAAGTPPIP